MSLIGNLEDLSLPDILQIISLSKKSGVLSIHRGDEKGIIYLHHGKVILTSSDRHRRNLGDILLEKGFINEDQLLEALSIQKRGGMKELLGHVLVKLGFIDNAVMEKIIEGQIEESVFYFLSWREGTFKFEIQEVDSRLEVGVDPQILISQKGIDTQWLVLEGTRLLDEKRDDDTFNTLVPGDKSAHPETIRTIALVDDDEYFIRCFRGAALKRNIDVVVLPGVVEAQNYLSTISTNNIAMVVEVVLPTADNRGFLGGLELARFIASKYSRLPHKVITAYPDDSINEELDKIGASDFLLKPDLSGMDAGSGAMDNFLGEILDNLQIAPAESSRIEKASAEPVRPAEPEEAGIEAKIAATTKQLEETLNSYPLFRRMAEELVLEISQANNPSEIGLSILRLASELLDRSILFKSNGDEIISLGGFGFEPQIIKRRDGLRKLSISLKNSEILSLALHGMKAVKGPPSVIGEDDLLGMMIGKPDPASWIVLPAKGAGESVLLLYGDTASTGHTIKADNILHTFMILSGLTMNKLYNEMMFPNRVSPG